MISGKLRASRFEWSIRSVLTVALVNVLVLFVLIAVLEGGTRLLIWLKWDETAYLKYGIKYPSVNFSHVGPLYYHDMGGYLAFRPMTHPSVTWAEGPVYINKYGFRNKEFLVEKPSGIYRIITMGESSTFGFHVSDNKAWPYLINEKFKGRTLEGKVVEVINLGLPWYNSKDNLNLLDFALRLQPDLVIYYGGANDIVDLSLRQLREQEGSAPSRWVASCKRYSLFLYKVHIQIQSFAERLTKTSESSVQAQTSDVYFAQSVIEAAAEPLFVLPFEQSMLEFKKRVEGHQAKFFMISQIRAPLGRDWLRLQKEQGRYNNQLADFENALAESNFYSFDEAMSRKLMAEHRLNIVETIQYMHARLVLHLKAFAARNGIAFLDFVQDVNGNFSLLTTDLHLTEEGNEELARAVFGYLTR